LISAGLDEALIQQARLAEAFSILAKPISRSQITSAVDAALRRIYNWPNDVPDDPQHRI
jgi:AmiR/NasT family two-component response regulator